MPQAEPLLIFLHIPKTAGSTLQSIIFNNYRPEEIYWIDPDRTAESLAAFADMSDEEQSWIRILAGHMTYGVHKLAKRPHRYFTMLRDPIERIISMYYYIRSDPKHFIYHEACAMDLNEFIKSRVIAQFDNGQTRFLDENLAADAVGTLERAGYKECTADSLERAKDNLRNNFAVVGISENYNASLLLLKLSFGWNRITYTRKNITQERPKVSTLDTEIIKAIATTNKFDLELYAYAQGLLRTAISAGGIKYRFGLKFFNLLQIFR